ncbi:MAG: DUF2239 family protein [Armatimonadetes bacterium]|nr:DUF2239 family protein [Armatimonadota bacterium]MBS1702057.1 DUF2239 family protein [Armatimonadota bacterium]MBS1728103.1 DUF2239 family protein [Armatimonadota bacterium]
MTNFNPRLDRYTAFEGTNIIAEGTRREVHEMLRLEGKDSAIIFEDWTGKQIDFDLAQPYQDAQDEIKPVGPGRPKLGVKAREVTLLPRHWDWLDGQRGGASAHLRQLVEKAMKQNPGRERVKQSQDACCRFLSAVAGNLPNFEEATRALYRKDRDKFSEEMGEWPESVRGYAMFLAHDSFLEPEPA